MTINEMTQQECAAFLGSSSFGRLGCSLKGQPYVVPIYIACEPGYIYVLSTVGQKIEWMRANPKVCLEVDEIAGQSEWTSVLVSGSYQELPEPQYSDERKHAEKLLGKHHRWWLNALGERQSKLGDELIEPLFFRVHIDATTGLRAVDDSVESKE